MSMFRDIENSTIPLPSEDNSREDEEDEFIRRMSSKRSPPREIVTDNFDDRYHQMNTSLFDQADPEIGDLDYRDFEFSTFSTTTDDVELQKAIEEETTITSETSPFSASSSLFETSAVATSPIPFTSSTSSSILSRNAQTFASTSPYFKAFPSTSTSSFISSSSFVSTSFEDSPLPTSSFESTAPIILSDTTEEEDKFFNEQEDIDVDVEDISTPSDPPEDVTTPMSSGLPTASFQGSSFMKLQSLTAPVERKDEHEVVQYNGRYSVSATKYYVDNRIDGEHMGNDVSSSAEPLESIEDTVQENTVEEVDPFAVEREFRKVAKMHASKTQVVEDPLKDLEFMMMKDREIRKGDDEPENETISMEKDENGQNVETRETTYHGQKTVVKLWNKNLHGHDLMRFPGAIFDDRIDEPRRKSDKRRAVSSRIVLSSDGGWNNFKPQRLRKVVAGVTTNVKNEEKSVQINEKERKTTEDVESVCFNTKQNTALVRISPFETDDNLTKLECLTQCARNEECMAATYSIPLSTCAMYGELLELQKTAIRSQGHSLHRKLSKTTLRCLRMFVSKEFFEAFDSEEIPEENENEISPPFLRLVEKDGLEGLAAVSSSLLFAQRPRCPEGQDVIFVRSDNVEASNHQERRDHVEITEDDCVFACLTNTRPGGGTSDCTAIEYDKTRGFCFLMTSAPGDVAMTPRPVHPVTTYEKICIQQKSANKCSGGQPIRHRQKVLIGHLVDAHSVGSAAECVDLCIEKHTIGCVSVMFYAKETTLNCILNDSTHLEDPASFYDETSTIVDFFSIQDCLGIREVNRRAKKRLFQNRADQLARLRRKMARI